jgi:hypothetical protein
VRVPDRQNILDNRGFSIIQQKSFYSIQENLMYGISKDFYLVVFSKGPDLDSSDAPEHLTAISTQAVGFTEQISHTCAI